MQATTSSADLRFYATCAASLAPLLAEELTALGIPAVAVKGAGVEFGGTVEHAYRALLWTRVANRILMPLLSGAAKSPEQLYALVQQIDWSEHVACTGSLAVDCFVSHSAITHSQYATLKIKDAVVDQFRDASGQRPDVDRQTPDLRINAYVYRDRARLAIDLSGASLHRRGYRQQSGPAPLKENLAAALLLAAAWPSLASGGSGFVDPLCGSGTLPIEAALIAGHRAPGLLREYFGFRRWRGHDEALWSALTEEALLKARPVEVAIAGYDQDHARIDEAREAARRAGVAEAVHFEIRSVEQGPPVMAGRESSPGLLLTNPPYGERLAGDARFYSDLGRSLSLYGGWQCGIFTATDAPMHRARLPLSSQLQASNGPIACELYTGTLPALRAQAPSDVSNNDPTPVSPVAAIDTSGFANRLRKNQRSLKGWLKQQQIRAYRLYDADLPEFALAVDVYHTDPLQVVVHEYQAPASVNRAMAEARLSAGVQVIAETLGVPDECLHLRVRSRMAGSAQYEKRPRDSVASVGHDYDHHYVEEDGMRLAVNFTDYLDTGLFLDHRPLRRYIKQHSAGKTFLNLFSYTATMSVAACVGGARETVSVDLSRRYSEWARHNLDINGANPAHHAVIRSDVREWLAAAQGKAQFDMILLDPPTFSNSSSVDADWDVQRDHADTLRAALALLSADGVLFFSTNYRRFRLDNSLGAMPEIKIEDRSRWSIDRDFQRHARIHQCWFITPQGG